MTLDSEESLTINVIVATYHAVVLGCDSLSSIVERAFFPFRSGSSFALDAGGNPILDADGNLTFPFSTAGLEYVPTNIMGGVQKMFLLHESQDKSDVQCSVAAATSGLAIVTGVSVAGHADRFRRTHRGEFKSAREVVEAFIKYMRPLWEQQVNYANVDEKLRTQLSDLNFMVAGYGPGDDYTKVFRVSIRDGACDEEFADPPHCSAAWAGQAASVARLINGIDPVNRWQVNRAVAETMVAQRQAITEAIVKALEARGLEVPPDIEIDVEEAVPPTLPWSEGTTPIDWPNLPTQYAVDLVSLLVNAESGLQRFSKVIPGVGGRTRIGLLRRGEPFEMLNEPAVVHSHLGYSSDA